MKKKQSGPSPPQQCDPLDVRAIFAAARDRPLEATVLGSAQTEIMKILRGGTKPGGRTAMRSRGKTTSFVSLPPLMKFGNLSQSKIPPPYRLGRRLNNSKFQHAITKMASMDK
jgi:hypothetical protein